MRKPLAFDRGLSRRDWFRLSAAGVAACSSAGWLQSLADDAADNSQRRRSCILLWMAGGPSQIDTFDLKPGHANGGEFKEIQTGVPGLNISEHLPQLARHAADLAVVRSMSTKEGDHIRATYLLRNGYLPQNPIRYPTLGSLVSKELGQAEAELPNFVSIAPYRTFSPAAYSAGYLGSSYDPLLVGDTPLAGGAAEGEEGEAYEELSVPDLALPSGVESETADARLKLLASLNGRFLDGYAAAPAVGHSVAYERAVRLMRSAAGKAFDLDEEPAEVRDAYGRTRFGQGCLLARRLVERGVPFVEVTLSGVAGQQVLGWDTHADNFAQTRQLCGALDPAWATLMTELKDRGLLESTTIVWMGEFGRTPEINSSAGRDHFPTAWTTVLGGGGIRGGQTIGRTSADGLTVEDRPVAVPDLLATVCRALGIDPLGQNISNVGRPIRIVDPKAAAIEELLA